MFEVIGVARNRVLDIFVDAMSCSKCCLVTWKEKNI